MLATFLREVKYDATSELSIYKLTLSMVHVENVSYGV